MRWDKSVARYRDESGRFVGRKAVLAHVDASLSKSAVVVEELADMVADGAISSADWMRLMRQNIKKEYIREYLLGRGGVNVMQPSDWGRIGGMLADQYRYLNNFAAVVGDLTAGQIKMRLAPPCDCGDCAIERSRMYMNSAREAFGRASEISHRDAGYTEESWHVDAAKENCDDCLSLQAEGRQPLGYFPQPGQGATRCLTNCGCSKRYWKQ